MKAFPDYKSGFLISILSCAIILIVFFLYSRYTSPENAIFLSPSLYNLAIAVLISFFASLFLFILGIKRAIFSKKVHETNGSRLIYYLQMPFRKNNYVIVFILSFFAYFIFFGFLSNMFILLNEDGTVYSLIPSVLNSNPSNHLHSSHTNHTSDHLQAIKALESGNLDFHAAHPNHLVGIPEPTDQESTISEVDAISYPGYRLIICCNNFGYVPMLTVYINSNFSFLLIPLNFFIGVVISLLVGLNISLNIFVIKQLQINFSNFSKGNLFSGLGSTSGLLVGCPTCAGSLLYSIAGFSSLITFSSLGLYQMFFVVISIPFLIISLVIMANLLRKRLCTVFVDKG